jgi:hypothetical protein
VTLRAQKLKMRYARKPYTAAVSLKLKATSKLTAIYLYLMIPGNDAAGM